MYETLDELDYLHQIVKGTRQSKVLSDKESLIIIFGYENGFEWVGYIYKELEWKRIRTVVPQFNPE